MEWPFQSPTTNENQQMHVVSDEDHGRSNRQLPDMLSTLPEARWRPCSRYCKGRAADATIKPPGLLAMTTETVISFMANSVPSAARAKDSSAFIYAPLALDEECAQHAPHTAITHLAGRR